MKMWTSLTSMLYQNIYHDIVSSLYLCVSHMQDIQLVVLRVSLFCSFLFLVPVRKWGIIIIIIILFLFIFFLGGEVFY
jgi:hypothetical protein